MVKIILLMLVVFLQPALIFSASDIVHVKAIHAKNDVFYKQYETAGECLSKASKDFYAAHDGTITEIIHSHGKHVNSGDIVLKINDSVAEAKYQAAKASFEREQKLFADGMTSNDKLRSSFINLENTRLEYEGMIIRAPFDGNISLITHHVGDVVSKGDFLFSIVNDSEKEIVIRLPHKFLQFFDYNTKIEVMYDNIGWVSAKVLRFSPNILKNSSNFIAIIECPNIDKLAHRSFVKVRLFLGQHNGISVPDRAVLKNNTGHFLFTIDGDIARLKYINIADHTNNRTEVISGVLDHDMIVTDGASKISDGSKIIIDEILEY